MNESRSWWSPCNDRGLMTDVAAITQINPQRRVESVMRFRKRLEHNEHVLTQSSNPVTNLLMSIVCYRFKPNWAVGGWALPKIWFSVMAASYLLQKSSRTQNMYDHMPKIATICFNAFNHNIQYDFEYCHVRRPHLIQSKLL